MAPCLQCRHGLKCHRSLHQLIALQQPRSSCFCGVNQSTSHPAAPQPVTGHPIVWCLNGVVLNRVIFRCPSSCWSCRMRQLCLDDSLFDLLCKLNLVSRIECFLRRFPTAHVHTSVLRTGCGTFYGIWYERTFSLVLLDSIHGIRKVRLGLFVAVIFQYWNWLGALHKFNCFDIGYIQ